MRVKFQLAVICLQAAMTSAAGAYSAKPKAAASPEPFTTENERCIVPAANYHGVNHQVLRAILRVESGLRPDAVGRNDNGTIDVGIGQMNSMHFGSLARWGVTPQHLKDACVGTYVAAWHLSKTMRTHGNTWFGVAAYHSATPYFNSRYQALIRNELRRAGVLQGGMEAVPPLRRRQADQKGVAQAAPNKNLNESVVAFDTTR
jgi:soluble lytic murein transglycosylase-like protein